MLPALKPIMMRDRVSMIFIEYGQIDVVDGAFVVIDKNGVAYPYSSRWRCLHHARARYARVARRSGVGGTRGYLIGLGR